jgi:hypothetical protein
MNFGLSSVKHFLHERPLSPYIAGMLAELEKLGMPKRTIRESKRKNISYYFRFTGDQCDKLFHILYDDVPPRQYLERKYNIFKPNESD